MCRPPSTHTYTHTETYTHMAAAAVAARLGAALTVPFMLSIESAIQLAPQNGNASQWLLPRLTKGSPLNLFQRSPPPPRHSDWRALQPQTKWKEHFQKVCTTAVPQLISFQPLLSMSSLRLGDVGRGLNEWDCRESQRQP